MKKIYIASEMIRLLPFILFLFLIGCSEPKDDSLIDDFGENEVENAIQGFEEYSYNESHSSNYIYDQSKLHRFDIYITDKNLKILNDDPAAERYVNAHLVFDGEVVKDIGLRYKGSIGAWVGCLSGNDWTNPSGYKTCPKLSFKIKINRNLDRKFYGLKKLQFHSQNLDKSKMHERLGYHMFREFGVTASRSNHVVVYINGEFNGVFANTENIDGPFANHNFISSEGNIYKEVWPINSFGKANSSAYFIDGLKTNEELGDVSKILRFGNQLELSNENSINNIIGTWIDKELFLKTLVVDRRIANDDGFMHWYHDGGNFYSNHNYYWYEYPSEDKIQLIPWDLDNAFENLISDLNPVTPIKDNWNEITNNCNGFPFGALNIKQKSAACDKIIGSFRPLSSTYDSLDLLFKTSLYNMTNINNLIDQWSSQIESAVKQASLKFGDQEPSVEEWKDNMDFLTYSIEQSLN